MPVDTKATEYLWFMPVDIENRIVRVRWEPDTLPISSSMAMGTMTVEKAIEEDPDKGWEALHGPDSTLTIPVPWVVAETFARREGFPVEVPNYA